MEVSADLIQNTHYYYKSYGSRYQPGMRIECTMTPFIMRINHDDYNFIMKCVNWCVTFDDRADHYLYDIPDAVQLPTYQKDRQRKKSGNMVREEEHNEESSSSSGFLVANKQKEKQKEKP